VRAPAVYGRFARLYAQGDYPGFSLRMAQALPAVLERFGREPTTLLDLACGEGSFACIMAKRGLAVTGLDRSQAMLELARMRARRDKVRVSFVRQDMRRLAYRNRFDLVTCWFDSMNYLLELDDLKRVFRGAFRALVPRGLFIFDMNTRYGLAVKWTAMPCYIQQEQPDLVELHQTSFDHEADIASLKITGFTRRGRAWTRFDEWHFERAYPVVLVRRLLRDAGFRVRASWGSIEQMAPLRADSPRAWFVAEKP
jgi:SAM-dependent methyltransferase